MAPGPNAAKMEDLARAAGLQASPLSWAKFCRETNSAPEVKTSLSIRKVGVEERNLFAESAIAGFGMPAPMAVWLSQIVGRPHWHAYASFDGSAAGAM